jgi:2-polyprenyl-3-methyl-5-hydroxy-6-metoxy-1,4-benzoquinol methylase
MPHYRLHRDPRSSHQQIAKRLRELGRGPVLDVGAAQGMLGELLTGSGLVMDAVEPNPQWAEHCKPFYRKVITGSIEDAPLGLEKYGAIVCADVLEHTPDPAGVLQKLRGLAAPDAVFLISLPNIAHLSVRLMLLVERFPKMDRGILDKTHLHFYTRATATHLLEDAGLRIGRVSATGVPLDEIWKMREGGLVYNALMSAQYGAVRMFPRMFAMQFIFEATPNNNSSA